MVSAAKRRVFLFGILMIGAAFTLYEYRPYNANNQKEEKHGHNHERGITTVAIAKANIGDIHVYLTALGTVTSVNTNVIKSRVDGQLLKINFTDGQTVKPGDLLAEIDPRPYQALLQQTVGQLTQDQALLANAQVDLRRYQGLFAEDSVSKQQLDTQETLVKQYIAAIKIDQGAIDNARVQLAYCHITAPVGGRLGLRQIDSGNIIHASDSNGLATITQLQPIEAIFSIPEDNIPSVIKSMQQENNFLVDAWDRTLKNKISSGKLITIDNQIDVTTGSIKLKAQFDNENHALFPNQFVNVKMETYVKRNVVIVPTRAIQLGKDGYYAYVVADNKTVHVQPIAIGETEEDKVSVEQGLTENTLVVIDGTDQLHDGDTVETAFESNNDNPAPAPPASADALPAGATESSEPHKSHYKK